jgi:Response regulator containing a CheY-like receiver domain and an HTH DNA-binding domain
MPRNDPTSSTLAVVGGPRLFREAIGALLDARVQTTVTGTYRTALDMLGGSGPHPPDAVLLDVDDRPWLDVELIRVAKVSCTLALLCSAPTPLLLDRTAEGQVDCIILKDDSPDEVAAAVEHALGGHLVMPARWHRPEPEARSRLSRRHQEVLGLVSEGMSTEQIAAELGISPHTVKFHLRELYWRLGVRNRVEATRSFNRMSRPVA